MSNQPNQVGIYEITALFIGCVVSVCSVWHYWAAIGNTATSLTIGGVSLPFLLLLLTSIEVAGVFAAAVFSTVRQSYVGVMILPHAAIAVAVTVALGTVLQITVG